jgi:outer membrane murein-binding lipoprotein Lpp
MKDREILELLLKKVDSIESNVSLLKSDVTTLKSDVSTLKSDVSTLKSDVSTLKSDVSSLNKKVGVIFDQTAKLSEYHDETTSKLDTIMDDQISMQGVLGEHEIIIRTLRRRAV